MTGCSESDLARSMAEAVTDGASPAGALAELRDLFPDMSLRVATLHVLLRRRV